MQVLNITAVEAQVGDLFNVAPWLVVAPGFDFEPSGDPVWLELTDVSRRGKYTSAQGEVCFDHVVLRTPHGAVPAGFKEKHRFKVSATQAIMVQRAEVEAPAEEPSAPVAPVEAAEPEAEPAPEPEPADEPADELEPETEEFEHDVDDLEDIDPEFEEFPDLEDDELAVDYDEFADMADEYADSEA